MSHRPSKYQQANGLWDLIQIDGVDKCWLWQGKKHKFGYGRFEGALVHRLVFEDKHRKLQTGEVVRHSCDNPACCNPNHLLAGSQADNVRDMVERGRARYGEAPKGEQHHSARFTASLARTIRERHQQGEKMLRLAREYQVHVNAIWSIVYGLTWKNAGGPIKERAQ